MIAVGSNTARDVQCDPVALVWASQMRVDGASFETPGDTPTAGAHGAAILLRAFRTAIVHPALEDASFDNLRKWWLMTINGEM